jgi:plastocyanin
MTFSIRALSTGVAFVLSVGLFAPVASADSTATHWHVTVGAQSPDMGIQVSTYFPNDITIDAGDSVTWTSQTAEPHTITFLAGGQAPPEDPFSPPAGGSNYSGSGYFNSGPIIGAPAPGFLQSYTLTFSQPGTYAYICLFHPFMTGTVHVQPTGAAYPESQSAYDRQSNQLQHRFLAQGDALRGTALGISLSDASHAAVAAGAGNGTATVMRFLPDRLAIPVGTTVTWTNRDPMEPHTVTFGPEPKGPNAEFTPVGLDGPAHATISHPDQQVNSGAFGGMLSPSTFKVTFSAPGKYPYICMLHDMMGMVGTIIVGPVARDGQSLYDQPEATQAQFTSIWGKDAAQHWADEHNAARSPQ